MKKNQQNNKKKKKIERAREFLLFVCVSFYNHARRSDFDIKMHFNVI